MTNHTIRVYKNPAFTEGTTLGLCYSSLDVAGNAGFLQWLSSHGYKASSEPLRTQTDVVPRAPAPANTMSSLHLYIEPPLKPEHLKGLASALGETCFKKDQPGSRVEVLDNRGINPLLQWKIDYDEADRAAHDTYNGAVISHWEQPVPPATEVEMGA